MAASQSCSLRANSHDPATSDSHLCRTMNECVSAPSVCQDGDPRIKGYNQTAKASTLHSACSFQPLSFMLLYPKSCHHHVCFTHRKTKSDPLREQTSSQDGRHSSKTLPEKLVGTLSRVMCSPPGMWRGTRLPALSAHGTKELIRVHC